MTANPTVTYKRSLKKHLSREYCSGKTRSALLARFDTMVNTLAEDCPSPTAEDLNAAFGTPEQLAQVLLAGMPQEEVLRREQSFRRAQVLRHVVLAVLAAALVLGFAYAWWFKEYSIHAAETIVIWK